MSRQQTVDNSSDAKLDKAALFPLLSGEGNQRLLVEWIEAHDRYTLVDPEQAIETATFDCCILDGETIQTHADTLRARKRKAEPVLLPCLLLVPEADLSVIETDRGEIADSVVFETADEVVSIPIKKAELEWRMEALLRLRAQSRQLESQRHELRLFKEAAEAAGHAIYITNTDGTIEYVNPAFEEATGYKRAEAVGETPALLSSGEMPTEYYDRLWETISTGNLWEEDIINQRKDGTVYHAHQTIAPVTDETGTPVKFVAIQSDITQRVKATQRLEIFRNIIERLEDPIMLQDRDGRFQIVNKALTEYAEMSRENLHGKTEFAFMDEEAAKYIQARKEQVLDQEEPVQYSISPTFPTEDDETFSTVRYPYYGQDGSLGGTFAICRVVTELKSREDQLQVLDRVLRHNLRNDMTTIGMFAEEMQASLSGEVAETAERIRATSEQVNQMVDKQRKITKFLTDTPNTQTIDLAHIVEIIVTRLRKTHPNAEIRTELPETCPVESTTAIEQGLAELVENAIVHSDLEAPSVEIRVTENQDGPAITIADNGPGMAEMDQQILEGGAAIDQLYHGSGLGLWLVYLIVTHSGGTLSVTAKEPRGSVVTVQLFE